MFLCQKSLTVAENITANGGITSTGNITANSGITATGNITANSGITVAGVVNANGGIGIANGQVLTNNGNCVFQGIVSANGGISMPPSATLTNSGTSTLGGTITLNRPAFVIYGITISTGGMSVSTGNSISMLGNSSLSFSNTSTLTLVSGTVLSTQLPHIKITGNWTSGAFASNSAATVLLPSSSIDANRSRSQTTFSYNQSTGIFTIPMTGIYAITMICDSGFDSVLWRFEAMRSASVIYTLNRSAQLWKITYRFTANDQLSFRYFNYSASSQNMTRALDLQISFIN